MFADQGVHHMPCFVAFEFSAMIWKRPSANGAPHTSLGHRPRIWIANTTRA